MGEELQQLRTINKLKSVYRESSVDNRNESTAEHTWSAIVLADYFLTKHPRKINKQRVFELLLYHDFVEIETGDIPLTPGTNREGKKEREIIAAPILAKKLPEELAKNFLSCFDEYEKQLTVESRYAKAIDKLDAQLHELDYKEDWKGWSEEYLREKIQKHVKEFPELEETFEELICFCNENNYFEQ